MRVSCMRRSINNNRDARNIIDGWLHEREEEGNHRCDDERERFSIHNRRDRSLPYLKIILPIKLCSISEKLATSFEYGRYSANPNNNKCLVLAHGYLNEKGYRVLVLQKTKF